MRNVFLKIADKLRMPYDPSPVRRNEVVRRLSQRPRLAHKDWHDRFAPDIPLAFVSWFREACSQYFDYDLSAALPGDRLIEDLGMYDATFGDVDMDILEDYEARYGVKLPDKDQASITTFGELLRVLWLSTQERNQSH